MGGVCHVCCTVTGSGEKVVVHPSRGCGTTEAAARADDVRLPFTAGWAVGGAGGCRRAAAWWSTLAGCLFISLNNGLNLKFKNNKS
jgi:hypothetical protein